jgi:phosphoribosylglycinamide formyltransferase 1
MPFAPRDCRVRCVANEAGGTHAGARVPGSGRVASGSSASAARRTHAAKGKWHFCRSRPPGTRCCGRAARGRGVHACRVTGRLLDCGVLSSTHTLAVLASGRGTNLQALVGAERQGRLGAPIALLACDVLGAPVLQRARELGVETLVLPGGRYRTRVEDEEVWIRALHERGVDTVLLAGFMRRLHAPFLEAFGGRILNLHPSLLPAFPGLDAIRQAWEHGARLTGCTVHLVDETLDGGPIVAQAAVEVRDGESLSSLEGRVHEVEHALYPAAVHRFLTESFRIDGRRLLFTSSSGAAHA